MDLADVPPCRGITFSAARQRLLDLQQPLRTLLGASLHLLVVQHAGHWPAVDRKGAERARPELVFLLEDVHATSTAVGSRLHEHVHAQRESRRQGCQKPREEGRRRAEAKLLAGAEAGVLADTGDLGVVERVVGVTIRGCDHVPALVEGIGSEEAALRRMLLAQLFRQGSSNGQCNFVRNVAAEDAVAWHFELLVRLLVCGETCRLQVNEKLAERRRACHTSARVDQALPAGDQRQPREVDLGLNGRRRDEGRRCGRLNEEAEVGEQDADSEAVGHLPQVRRANRLQRGRAATVKFG
mmetsp:Transcript_146021/g.468272  ORF Transcript_146021/g.468272 Transcript_146021/m.468272 type:complete len:297 (+) Transcript_146021:189-1079(+)